MEPLEPPASSAENKGDPEGTPNHRPASRSPSPDPELPYAVLKWNLGSFATLRISGVTSLCSGRIQPRLPFRIARVRQ